MDRISVRPASDVDVAALAAVGRESFAQAYSPYVDTQDLEQHLDANFSTVAIRGEMARDDCRYLIAEVGVEPAGLCKLLASPAPEAVTAAPSLEIRQLYVLPDFQRYGLGRRMVDAAFAQAATEALAGIWLGVWERADWALGFYRRCGFRIVDNKQFRIGDTDHNDLVMWRETEDTA